jgi:hypothetical protein
VPRLSSTLRSAVSLLVTTLAFASAQSPGDGSTREQEQSSREQGHAELAPLRVLFIGNSLTTSNDLPALVEAIAAVESGPRFECEVVALPNYSLEDHWRQGDAVRAIRRGGWSVVVLQQGPSSLDESRVLLVEYAERFAGEIRRVGARPALYMVWPSQARRADFERASASYAAAARAVDGVLLPAGDAWRRAWRLDADLPLYGPDGFHPSRLGSILGALIIYRGLVSGSTSASEEPAPDATRPLPWALPLGVEVSVASTLERAAAAAQAASTE